MFSLGLTPWDWFGKITPVYQIPYVCTLYFILRRGSVLLAVNVSPASQCKQCSSHLHSVLSSKRDMTRIQMRSAAALQSSSSQAPASLFNKVMLLFFSFFFLENATLNPFTHSPATHKHTHRHTPHNLLQADSVEI